MRCVMCARDVCVGVRVGVRVCVCVCVRVRVCDCLTKGRLRGGRGEWVWRNAA